MYLHIYKYIHIYHNSRNRKCQRARYSVWRDRCLPFIYMVLELLEVRSPDAQIVKKNTDKFYF